MTFQRAHGLRVIRLVRRAQPGVRIVVGGYDPSLAPEVYEPTGLGVDYIVRGEGDLTFRELLRALDARRARRRRSPGCRIGPATAGSAHTPRSAGEPPGRRGDRAAEPRRPRADGLHVPRPADRHRRDVARLHVRLQLLFDHRDARPQLPHLRFSRVLADIARRQAARRAGDLPRRRQHHAERRAASRRCAGRSSRPASNDIDYIVQAMTSSIASHGETLAPLMREAGFRYVFLGIENVLDEDLAFLRARGEERARARAGAGPGNATLRAIELLHRARHVRRRRPHRRQPGRHARVDRGEPRVRAAATSTGRTSSIRRRTPARR